MRGARSQIYKGQACYDGAQGKAEAMNLRIGDPSASCRPRLLCAAPAMGLRKGAVDVIVGLSPIVFSLSRRLAPALTGVRVRVIRLTRAGALRPRRRGTFLRTLRGLWVLQSAVVRGALGCWRGTPGKANVSLPFAVVISVCHSYRLVSCITRLSYKKDAQQMRAYAKTSVNGTKGAKGAVRYIVYHACRTPCPLLRAEPGATWVALWDPDMTLHCPRVARGTRSRARRKGPCEPLSKDGISNESADHRTSISTVTNETVITVSRAMYLAAVLI